MARQKRARQSTAAYAASQPLFTALKDGFERLGEQRAALNLARDLVQNLHVKLVHEDGVGKREEHQRYVHSIVTAWRSAVEVYIQIFKQLVDNTAADASEGRPASRNHEDLAAMLDTMTLAARAVMHMQLDAEIDVPSVKVPTPASEAPRAAPGPPASDDPPSVPGPEPMASSAPNVSSLENTLVRKRSRPDDDDEDGYSRTEQPQQKVQKRDSKIKYSKDGKPLWERGAELPFVPFASLGSNEKKEWQKEVSQQKREKTREKTRLRREAKIKAKAEARKLAAGIDLSKPFYEADYIGFDTIPNNTQSFPLANGLQYEDVSAEAAARMTAKEQKRIKPGGKKRKRESGDSILIDDNNIRDPLAPVAGNAKDKPKKKKARQSAGPRAKKKKKKSGK